MTILYIKNEHCTSVEQLKGYFSEDLTPESDTYVDLLDYGRHGDIAKWLGEMGEAEMAECVDAIDTGLSDSAYFVQLKSLITGVIDSNPAPLKLTYEKCFYIGNEDLKIEKSIIHINLPITFTHSINESYKISIKIADNEESLDLNPSDYKTGETKIFKFSLEKPKEPLQTICVLIDNEVYRTINDLPLYQSELLVCYNNYIEKATLITNQGDKLFDTSVEVLFTGELFLIVANIEENKMDFVSTKEIKSLGTYSEAQTPSINYSSYGNGFGQLCISWQSDYFYFIVNNGNCYPRDEFVFDYCKEHKFPYVTLATGFEKRIYNLQQWQQSQIADNGKPVVHTVPGIWGQYIGELNGESIFWCVQSARDGYFNSIIIDSKGKKIRNHPYNSIVVPTWDKNQFIAINGGSKYGMMVFLTTDGNIISRYRLKNRNFYPNIFGETKHSIVFSDEIRYLKSENMLVEYRKINSHFYVITSKFIQDDYSAYYISPRLCSVDTDEVVSVNFDWNGKVENICCGYIALYGNCNRKAIMSPEGKIVFTLNENEDIRLQREYFSNQSIIGKSNTAFIIYCPKTRKYKVVSHDGVLIMEIQTKNDEFVVAYYMRRLYAYSRNEIIYYTHDKERYSTPIGKRRTIKNIEVLSNGYILVEFERAYDLWNFKLASDLSNFELLSVQGDKVCSADRFSIIRAED